MSYLRRPSWYKKFQCIASACTDSCCADWEIDIDEETCRYYNQVPGEFGERLRKNIEPENPENGEPAHFIQTEKERCPFLNERNLCDILLTIGEEHLSYICTHHPRFYEWFCDGREAGLGLCCEEAARLLLLEKGRPVFEELEEEPDDAGSGDYDDEERETEQMLFSMREELFDIINDHEKYPSVDAVLDELDRQAWIMQERLDDCLDDFLYPAMLGDEDEMAEECLPDEEFPEDGMPDKIFSEDGMSEDCLPGEIFPETDLTEMEMPAEETSFTDWYHDSENLKEICAFYQSLEINDMSWWGWLEKMKKQAKEILEAKAGFMADLPEKDEEFRQLLNYFIYRHFMKSRDGDVQGRIGFAIMSVAMIRLQSIRYRMQEGSLSGKDQVDVCKLYSKEVEYDEDNTADVADYFIRCFRCHL